MKDAATWKVLVPLLLVAAGAIGWNFVALSRHGERIAAIESTIRSVETTVDRIWRRLER